VVATLQAALMRHIPEFPNTFPVFGANASMGGAAVKIALIYVLLALQELALCRARSQSQREAH